MKWRHDVRKIKFPRGPKTSTSLPLYNTSPKADRERKLQEFVIELLCAVGLASMAKELQYMRYALSKIRGASQRGHSDQCTLHQLCRTKACCRAQLTYDFLTIWRAVSLLFCFPLRWALKCCWSWRSWSILEPGEAGAVSKFHPGACRAQER